jgi:hypothetical protein
VIFKDINRRPIPGRFFLWCLRGCNNNCGITFKLKGSFVGLESSIATSAGLFYRQMSFMEETLQMMPGGTVLIISLPEG